MATAAPALIPTLLATRRIPKDLGSQALTIGGPDVTVQLAPKGWLSYLVVHVSGTYTVANAALVFNQLMPFNIIKRFLIEGTGEAVPINLGGFGAKMWNLVERHGSPAVTGFPVGASASTLLANAYDSSLIDAAGTAVGAQTLNTWTVLAFERSSMDTRGVFPLGVQGQIINLVMTPASAADLVTTPANLTVPAFTVRVTQVYYTPVSAGIQNFDQYWSMQYDETFQTVAQTGLQTIQITPNGTFLGIIHAVCLNNAQDSADVASATLELNDTYVADPQGLPMETINFLQRQRYGYALPVGVIAYDEDHFADFGSLDVRDWIHTANLNQIQSFITIASSAVLGTNPRIYTWTRRLFRLAASS
jgi:hypothetical protein